jgi:hypothetical protein
MQAMLSLRDLAHDGCMVVYTYYRTAAGNSSSTQLCSSCQRNRYGTEKAGGTAHTSHTKSHLLSRAAVLGQPSSLRPHNWLYNSPIQVGREGVFYLPRGDYYLSSWRLEEGERGDISLVELTANG